MSDVKLKESYLQTVESFKRILVQNEHLKSFNLKEKDAYTQIRFASTDSPSLVHYEFMLYMRESTISCEIHIEDAKYKNLYQFLKDNLQSKIANLISQKSEMHSGRLLFDPTWSNNNGRLRIVFTSSFVPENIAKSMYTLIMETQMPIKEEIKRLASIKPNRLDAFPEKSTIWQWISHHEQGLPTFLSTAENQNYTATLNLISSEISYMWGSTRYSTSKTKVENRWRLLLKNGTEHWVNGDDFMTLWACGWRTLQGLVYNDGSDVFLRYIPVNLDLFDSVMAELGLRRQPTNNDADKNVAVYKPSDWVSKTDESDWRVKITRTNNAGFTVIAHQKDVANSKEISFEGNVKQFGEYDFSQPNANTFEGETEGRFYVSWPEKMLLQEFFTKKMETMDLFSNTLSQPKIFWCIKSEESSTNFTSISFKEDISNLDADDLNINSPSMLDNSTTICSSQLNPFLFLIRPDDYCIRTPKKILSLGQFTNKVDAFNRTITQINEVSPEKILEFVREKGPLSTTPEIDLSNGIVNVLKHQWASISAPDGGFCKFTKGFTSTKEYPKILFKDFIEQRAKVLDPTSRALLVHLKYNTPIEESPEILEDDMSEENTVSPTEMNRKPDSLSNNDTIQRLTLSKNLILEGVPGTGKTYAFNNEMVEEWEKQLDRETVQYSITMHPSTSYEDFLEGLRPQDIEQRQSTPTLNIPLKNNRFISRETDEIIYVEDRTEKTIKVATVPKSILGEFLQHAVKQTWDENYNQGDAKKSFEKHTTWNTWPLTDGATFHGVAKYYLEHDLTVVNPLTKTVSDTSTPKIPLCAKHNVDQSHWFFHPPKKVQGNFSVQDGFFLNVCKEAVQNPSKDYLVLLDEINRCNIPSVFGDLLTAIERSKRATWDNDNQCWNLDKAQTITLAISKRQFFVPENVYIVGTMNTTDRSVAPMDMALRRRFAFHRIEPTVPEKTFDDQPIINASIAAMKILNEGTSDADNKTHGLKHWGADALLGYSYIYDLASDLERYPNNSIKHAQIVQHHWNHHILPQLADILFSNQITGDERKSLLKLIKVNVGEQTYGVSDTTSTNESNLQRSILLLKTT